MTTQIALTALESHWGKPKNTLLLTDGCRLRDGGRAWEAYPEPVDTERLHEPEVLEAAYARCKALTTLFFPLLAERLDHRLGLGFPLRFYERILYPWFFQFSQALYERYTSICRAAALGDVRFLTVPTDQRPYPPKDAASYAAAFAYCDKTNLFVYSDIAAFLELPRKDAPLAPLAAELPVWGGSPQGQERPLERALMTGMRLGRKSVHLSYGCCGVPNVRTLLRAGCARLIPARNHARFAPVKLDTAFRNTPISPPGSEHDDFTRLLGAFLPRYLPFGMCECLPDLVRWARTQRLPHKGVLATNVGFAYDLPLLVLAGVRQRPLAILEHGGCMPLRCDSFVDIQKTTADRYYSLGASDYALPNPALAARKTAAQIGSPLLVGDEGYRYLPRLFPVFCEGSCMPYHAQRIDFLRALPRHLFPEVRLYFSEFGWGARKSLDDAFPGLIYQNANSTPIEKALAESCLVVLDHCLTTFFRCMALNRPTLVFAPLWPFADTTRKVLTALQAAGILHATPESAAAHYTRLIPAHAASWAEAARAIDEWWLAEETQTARDLFCSAYMRSADGWTGEWLRAFDELAEAGPRTEPARLL